ncbi:universal stress protein [Streptomyces sp. WMMB 322]|uniref:universal stress protein n=1 Tax=Streptomyces sp. WMMB 322 TaxID=1286821 RepID=UPI000823F788|nr:universal stress protein [Streptomyces sp. WMMB 322]SCK46313.1 hypothetical protein H180DRAFT_04115 [Streptomyces sp. WMMB 322]
MERMLSQRAHGSAPRPARAGLAQPVAAVLTDRMDDVAVAEAAVRLALARRSPLLLIVVMPPRAPGSSLGPESAMVRAVLARVIAKVGPCGTGYVPEVFHRPAGSASRLAAARELLALAARHRAAAVAAAGRGPEGLDAFTLTEAAALYGGPYVKAAAPAAGVPRRPTSP